MFNDNKNYKELVSVQDRHLFDKKDNYFYKSKKETLELWELKVNNMLKKINVREKGQPCKHFTIPHTNSVVEANNIESNVEPTFESRLQRIKEFIAKAKRVRKKRKKQKSDDN